MDSIIEQGQELTEVKAVEMEQTVSTSLQDTTNNDPYAYLERNGFTSEKFKIEIKNLPKYYGIKELKKLLNIKLKLNTTKIKVPQSSQRNSWVYVCFKSDEEKAHALDVLNNYQWKGSSLKAEEAKPIPDPLVQKRVQSLSQNETECKRARVENIEITVKDVTTPLWRTAYPDQLERKTQIIRTILKKFGNQLINTNPELSSWWKTQKMKFNGLPCEVFPIRYSDVIDGYRNKCEFSIGINEVTGEKTVGFRIGSYVNGSVSVAPIQDVSSVPKQMKHAVEVFQKFIRQSKYDVFNPELQQGYWKQLTARYSHRSNQLMLVIGFHPQTMAEEDLNHLKADITHYFTDGEGKCCVVNSLYIQQMTKKKSQDDQPVYEHVFGDSYITEQVLGKIFRISPQAFFQVNTKATEILYESIGEMAELTGDKTLLDVCCGTGSIGICLSHKCGEVLGIEISPEAIADAKANAEANNVTNAQFYAGKAEEILGCVAHRATKQEIIAVVDPPRPGLGRDALIQIRKNESIKKLIYIACDPGRVVKNFVDLGRATSKMYRNEPFVPVRAVPVDLFPHTPHCELIIYFERQTGA